MEEYLTTGQVAEQLDMRRHNIIYIYETKKLPEPIRISGRRMFSKSDIKDLISYMDKKRKDGPGRPLLEDTI